MQEQNRTPAAVRAAAGIDAAVTVRHHIAVRQIYDDGTEHISRFTADPTLAGAGEADPAPGGAGSRCHADIMPEPAWGGPANADPPVTDLSAGHPP
ncbi:MAG: hypothetical protein ABJA81_09195 [Nocardioidaceae bacterium]